MPYFKEYNCTHTTGDTYVSVSVSASYKTQEYFSALPTEDDLEVLFGEPGLICELSNAFEDCTNMKASPRLPITVYNKSVWNGLAEAFMGCSSLLIPPLIPKNARLMSAFEGCASMAQAPVIPTSDSSITGTYMFRNCSSLRAPCSIPSSMYTITSIFEGCSAMSGEFIIRSNVSTYTDALKNTTKPITIYGNRTRCEAVAATANNGNAHWSAWYDPVPAVTNRGQGSYTTAEDMTRMVRNGALAVNTYAPGRMVYSQGDIVREDEWNALVEAAKTIDPTVTYSTHYANLNKIEAAFDSAL